jgi:hypothetical protein
MTQAEIMAEYLVGVDICGAESVGKFDPTLLIQAASEITQQGIKTAQSASQDQATSRDDEGRAAAAIAADSAATDACTIAAVAKKTGAPAAEVAAKQALASQTSAAQDAVSAGLSKAASGKRADAAQAAAKAASQAWAADSGNYAKEARAMCANATAMKAVAGSGQVVTLPASSMQPTEESFLSKKVGPLPVWGWLLGALGLGGGVVVLRRR